MNKPITYTQQELSLIWSKGLTVTGTNSASYRKDVCGAWMAWSEYGNRNSTHGWEVDHIVPLSRGGTHHISNVQPLHWENNASKSNGSLVCVVSSRG